MNEVKLVSLQLRNFKGIKALKIEFGESVTNIYGTNEAGKTTTLDAYNWLLFDKDSTGASNFSIKTLDSENNPIHKLEHEVSAIVDYNGIENSIKKVYTEKWTKPRGQEDEVFSGHTTQYYWNDSPLSKSDYQSKINNIIPEETFKVLTNPTYFNTIHWEERRKILMSIAGEVSNEKVLDMTSTDPKMKIVSDILRNKQDLQESKKAFAAKRKRLNDELKLIPSRIDEVERAKIEDYDYSSLEAEKSNIESEVSEIEKSIESWADKNKAANQKVLDAQNEKSKLKTRLNELNDKVKDYERGQTSELKDEIYKIDQDKSSLSRDIETKENSIRVNFNKIDSRKNENKELKIEYAAIKSSEFNISEGDTKCSCCGQELPDSKDKIAKLKSEFERKHQQRIEQINDIGVKNAEEIKALESKNEELSAEIKELNSKITERNNERKALEDRLNNVEQIKIPKELSKEVKEVSEKIENFKMPEEKLVGNSDLKIKKQELLNSLDEVKGKLSKKDHNKKADSRISELNDQRKNISQEVATLESSEIQIEKFIKAKMDIVESRVNKLFTTCSFKMFEEQVNGGQKAVCECLVNGVPFHDVNNAGKINAGIDIINALQSYFEIKAPIWVDNRESVVNLFENDSQIVNLIVSEEHKELFVSNK